MHTSQQAENEFKFKINRMHLQKLNSTSTNLMRSYMNTNLELSW